MKIPESAKKGFTLIKAAFENGSIKKMSDLEKQKPTLIARLTGINQGRYGSKLFNPEYFTPSEIIRISLILDIDPGLIINIIKNERLEIESKRIMENINKKKALE